MIAHKLVPVSGYRDLERAKEQIIEKDEDVRVEIRKTKTHIIMYSWCR